MMVTRPGSTQQCTVPERGRAEGRGAGTVFQAQRSSSTMLVGCYLQIDRTCFLLILFCRGYCITSSAVLVCKDFWVFRCLWCDCVYCSEILQILPSLPHKMKRGECMCVRVYGSSACTVSAFDGVIIHRTRLVRDPPGTLLLLSAALFY